MADAENLKKQRHELHDLSTEQLEQKLVELREERYKLRFRSSTESIENPMRFRALRRDIARVLTMLGQKRRQA